MSGTSGKKQCSICGKWFGRGLGRHQVACERDFKSAQHDAAFELVNALAGAGGSQDNQTYVNNPTVHNLQSTETSNPHNTAPGDINLQQDDSTYFGTPGPTESESPTEVEFGDIRIEYHPKSRIPTKFQTFEEYIQDSPPPVIPEQKPWKPFRSRLDFEVAELALDAALNKTQANQLIKLIQRAVDNSDLDPFTLKNGAEMEKLWDRASVLRTNFEKHEFTMPYKDTEQTFEILMRDPWDWAIDIIKDRMLAPQFSWDAQIQSFWNGDYWERFFDEPWSAKLFWDTQSTLPDDPNAKVLAFVLYADKTKLSSFGTAKGYPIVARLGNLPVGIRNSDGYGGGRVVGWLPIVHEDTAETRKPGFVNFKNAVWHQAFTIFLAKIAEYSEVGHWVPCGDDTSRWLWPAILILSADYEEMSVMALTRGVRSLLPCPKCLVPNKELSNLSLTFPHRTQKQSENDFHEALKLTRAGKQEDYLKNKGLRMVKNSMWTVKNMDLHRALSYDTLHFDDNGLWEDHYFKTFKLMIQHRQDISKVDKRFRNMPRWHDLNHFESVMNITFNDGSKNRDISKIFLFAAHDILTEDGDSSGYLLLLCLRSYLNIRMYADFNRHTEKTLLAGRKELEDKLTPIMEKYITSVRLSTLSSDENSGSEEDGGGDEETLGIKSWNFPKLHLRQHLFDNIEDKGASRNSSTKINEKMHGPLKTSYHDRSNLKNFGEQILKFDHRLMISGQIRSNIDALDGYVRDLLADPEDASTTTHSIRESPQSLAYDEYRQLGSGLPPCTFEEFQAAHQQDPAFTRFRLKLGEFMTKFLPIYGISLPNGKAIKFQAEDMITEYRFLKVTYRCTADWQLKTSYLRCNPNFYGHPRYDCVLVNSEPQPYFARLVCIFTCIVNNQEYPLALVQPYLPVTPGLSQSQRKCDNDLELHRLRENFRSECEFVSVHTFIRGAVLIYSDEDTNSQFPSRDYFLFDLLDEDMFCRGRAILNSKK
ncbi:hypothetical protein BDZ94DRAFT_1267182 [Collybia nuda]|uniref:Transposase n=1 Tax=Collybia nuda TaxID=64659 RepID=A0A9P6CGF6_9AGAR|nr:hypothetical protein BDZ94DRAFT_1267182 [Collybia nuda]